MKNIYFAFLIASIALAGCSDDKPAPSNLSFVPSDYQITMGEGFSTAVPFVESATPVTFGLKDGHTYFKINASTGVITLPEGNRLEAGTYTIGVTASNGEGSTTFAEALKVTVKEIINIAANKAPSNLAYGESNYKVPASTPFTSPIPTVESRKEVTFALVNNYEAFSINSKTGEISLANDNTLSFGAYPLDVTVGTDEIDMVFENVVTITIYAPLPDALSGKGYELVWNDEFEGSLLNTDKWIYLYPGYTRGYGIVAEENVVINGDGTLSIRITEKEGKYYIGMIGTRNLFEATYGYFECSAQMQKSGGTHSSFWLQSRTYGATDNPAVDGSEIDIYEYLRRYPNIVYQTVHWNKYSGPTYQKDQSYTSASVKEGFHTFGLEWTSEGYTFYIDGKATRTTSNGLSHRDEYIVLSLLFNAWGGGGDGVDISTATTQNQWNFPDEVVFDYVRVFQKK